MFQTKFSNNELIILSGIISERLHDMENHLDNIDTSKYIELTGIKARIDACVKLNTLEMERNSKVSNVSEHQVYADHNYIPNSSALPPVQPYLAPVATASTEPEGTTFRTPTPESSNEHSIQAVVNGQERVIKEKIY